LALGNVLLSSAGRRVALLAGLRQDLADLNQDSLIVATDMSALSAASHKADRFVRVPPVQDQTFESMILDLIRIHNIGLVIPTIDTELPVYARLRDSLMAEGRVVLVSGPTTTDISADKRKTFDWLTQRNLPTVRQWDLKTAKNEADQMPYPVIVKPSTGSASIGVSRVDRPEDLIALDTDDLIVQELASGEEYTVDVWVDREGSVRCVVPRKRLEVRGGEVSKGVTEGRADVIEAVHAVVASLPDPFGPLTVQVFAGDAGEVRTIEINPRFGGGFPLSWAAGARYTKWAAQDAMGQEYVPTEFEWRDGLVMLRYDDAVFLNADEVGL
jgi:carbamoyl-phosphate synthase large subunit